MESKKQKEYTKKKETYNVRIIITILLMMVLLLGDLYVVLTDPSNFVALIVITVVALADAYVLIVSVIQQNYKSKLEWQEQYDSLYKSEKASYLLLRKNFEELEERLDRIEDGLGMPVDEIINAQKSIAKVTISRNKENSDALMNSNDKIFDKVFSLEDTIAQTNEDLLKRQEIVLENNNKDLILKQQELLSRMNELELSLKNEILSSVNKLSNITPQVVLQAPTAAAAAPVNPENYAEPAAQTVPEEKAEEPVEEEPVVEEPVIEEPVVAEPEPTVEEPAAEEPAVEEPAVEEPAVEEPVAEEPAPMPELSSDPNHIMTPDEIAALLAATTGAAEPEPVVEEPAAEEPVVEEPIAEEPAPMPEVTGDPNRMMTPEEIAALFANV
ncbi:MAG: hypothetical protein ACI4DO_05610 [Roseburia sp.]